MIDETDRQVIRALQGDIPLVPCPYAALAETIGLSEAEFLDRMRRLKETGCLRRVGAVLQHRRAGFRANALCAWEVPAERVDDVGAAVSKEPAVSHCYDRETAPGWPFNFYAMLHAASHDECESIAARLASENHLAAPRMFYSVKEWKKASMKYYTR
ncbi:MAG: AsnC family transcriptional regulator [Schwartzia sp.]|nr:AsnC family transcriptional regulator [Schwartzia sp. (in: firmicutes)]